MKEAVAFVADLLYIVFAVVIIPLILLLDLVLLAMLLVRRVPVWRSRLRALRIRQAALPSSPAVKWWPAFFRR